MIPGSSLTRLRYPQLIASDRMRRWTGRPARRATSPLRVTPFEWTRGTLTSPMPAAHFSRRTLVCMLAVGALALVAAGRASAGYGVGPDGQTFTVTADSAGYVQTPASLDLVVYLDAEDSSPAVWVSDSPAIGASGSTGGPSRRLLHRRLAHPLRRAEQVGLPRFDSLLQPGHTYYWWLDFARQDPGTPAPTDRVSGPFSFSLVAAGLRLLRLRFRYRRPLPRLTRTRRSRRRRSRLQRRSRAQPSSTAAGR